MEVALKFPVAKKLIEMVEKQKLKRLSSLIAVVFLTAFIGLVALDWSTCQRLGYDLKPFIQHLIVYILFGGLVIAIYTVRTVLHYYYRIKILGIYVKYPNVAKEMLEQFYSGSDEI